MHGITPKELKHLQHDVLYQIFEHLDFGFGLKQDTDICFSSTSYGILKKILENYNILIYNFYYEFVIYDGGFSEHKEVHDAFEFDIEFPDEDTKNYQDYVPGNYMPGAVLLKLSGELYYSKDNDVSSLVLVAKLW
jgi:hypothetical protein